MPREPESPSSVLLRARRAARVTALQQYATDVWPVWNTATTSASNVTVNAFAWRSWAAATPAWATDVTTTTSVTSVNVWPSWVAATPSVTITNSQPVARRPRYEVGPTPEERASRARREEEARAAREAERTKRIKTLEAAVMKAEQLLRSCLSNEQRDTLAEHGYFDVRGGATGTMYRVYRGRHINIGVLDDGGTLRHRICFAPASESCPDADAMLCQKLMLELDERGALAIANRHEASTYVRHGREVRILGGARRKEIIGEVIRLEDHRRAA